ncbi:hypothetical protein SAMN04488128_103440 [Chitinophaga eiseniae]|uniref:Uncharacterized protein n=1 Tax=Chitinophaga eiseniae TaxID=634771 RepID=A0A1T4STP8_9BACT|nr:hypothetical protein SAMN04488128_103440 [Chitinophaga eiseniae]
MKQVALNAARNLIVYTTNDTHATDRTTHPLSTAAQQGII